jgi:uncharacterized protein
MTPDLNNFSRAALVVALIVFAMIAIARYESAGDGTLLATGSDHDTAASMTEAPPQHGPLERLDLMTSAGTMTLQVEVARTAEQQMIGLMFRKSLADDRGMLFPHEPRETTMWMRNTFIPLDMVFILADGTIHRIEAMTEPMSERVIASGGAVSAVLEIAGGNAARLGLKPGDKVKHPFFSGKSSP